jgi:hypothetical protein
MQRNASAPATDSTESKTWHRYWALIVLASVMILAAIIRVRLAPCPLERDEGESAFIGQLMLGGIPPYKEAANMKFPGTYAAYAVIEAVFGQTAQGIHYGLLAVNLATILLVYHLGNRFFGSRHTAVMAAAIYAISSLSFSFMGPMAHATHFVVFLGLAGIALLFGALRWNSTLGFALAGAFAPCPFVESITVSDCIRQHSDLQDCIFSAMAVAM